MAFRIDDISIHLMPAGDKEKGQNKDENKEKRGERPAPQTDPNLINNDDGGHGQGCAPATGQGTARRRMQARDLTQALPLLQARLRETLAPPPL